MSKAFVVSATSWLSIPSEQKGGRENMEHFIEG